MPRISSYPIDTNISGSDLWIGSDGDNGLVTKNFSPDSLASYFNTQGSVKEPTFVFNQTNSSATWTINHNLQKFPNVTVVDSGGNVVMGFQTYSNNNQIVLTFSAPFTGSAYLN